MNILLVTSEAVPFAKTGGLADVCGALPKEVAGLGHQVTVMMPAYRQVHEAGLPIEPTGVKLSIPIGNKMVAGSLLRSHLPDSEVPVYFVARDDYYDREALYREGGQDYIDNCERFVFFCRAVMESIRLLDLKLDMIHVNDWQTCLIPAYLSIEYRGVPGYEEIASLLTVHNLAYQGQFWHWDMVLTGLDWKYFNWQQMECYGHLNLLKTGLVFCDAINTVSPRYSEEIQGPDQGCGLEGVLRSRSDMLSGIINGVDYKMWSPLTDPHIATRYGPETVVEGKADCKAALQRELGLPAVPHVPLIAFIGRLADQKGIDLVAGVMTDWASRDEAQWVLLGTGEPKYHELFSKLAQRHPDKIAVRLEFSEPLAHRIEAGADVFLMPSRYEPCGLNQLYSLKYGTVPVVRATGGLADTVTSFDEKTPDTAGTNGFSFREYSVLALGETLQRACNLFRSEPEVWARLVDTGMRQDWSWRRSAQAYIDLYEKTSTRVKEAVCS